MMGTVTFEKYLGQDGMGVKKTVFYKCGPIEIITSLPTLFGGFIHSEMYEGEPSDGNALVRSVEVYMDNTNTASDGVDRPAKVLWGYKDEDTSGYDFTCTTPYADLIDGNKVNGFTVPLQAVGSTKYATVVLVANSTTNIN